MEHVAIADANAADARLWCVVFDGFDPDLERVRESLLTLADGHVGACGATLAAHPGERRWVVAGGVYEGDGPATHLLLGPVGFHLPYRISTASPLRRVLDMRAGVLWEHWVSEDGLGRRERRGGGRRPRTHR